MGSPSKDLLETEGTLRELIETLIDSQEGFQKMGEGLKDEMLKRYFLAESLTRAEFRGELENILHQEGVADVKESGTAAGTFVRVWTGLKTALGGSDHSLLGSAEEAEDATRHAYADALDRFLPAPIREALVRQVSHIEQTHQYIQAAREASR